jgi:cell division protein FtsN
MEHYFYPRRQKGTNMQRRIEMKKIIAAVLVLGCLFAFVACGGDKDKEQPSAAVSASVAPAETQSQAPATEAPATEAPATEAPAASADGQDEGAEQPETQTPAASADGQNEEVEQPA